MLLELNNVSRDYPGVPGVLREVSLSVQAGASIAICGPSGSGKSTLLNIIGLLDTPSSGKLKLEGDEISALPEEDLARIRSRDIGFVFQLHHLLPQCTVFENVIMPALARSDNTTSVEPRARKLLERVGLQDRINSMPATLSGGESQRVAVVRALINSPSLLLADEPTGSLDADSSASLGKLLVELNKEHNMALITVTHSEKLAAMMGQRYDLVDGRLLNRNR